jgi:hypothetical protein
LRAPPPSLGLVGGPSWTPLAMRGAAAHLGPRRRAGGPAGPAGRHARRRVGGDGGGAMRLPHCTLHMPLGIAEGEAPTEWEGRRPLRGRPPPLSAALAMHACACARCAGAHMRADGPRPPLALRWAPAAPPHRAPAPRAPAPRVGRRARCAGAYLTRRRTMMMMFHGKCSTNKFR